MAPKPIDLAEKFDAFDERWSPKVIARLNDYEIKLAKLEGQFVWHSHAETEELFLVLDGELEIEFRDGPINLTRGQMLIVPRGVEHRPVARGLVQAMLIEPAGVINTGDASGELTATFDDSLSS